MPLSDRALKVLDEAKARTGDSSGLIFTNARGRPLHGMSLGRIHKSAGINATVHGYRSSFRTWAAECTEFPREIAEAALAHTNPNQIEAAYMRSNFLDQRRDLMQQWSAYITP